MVAKEIYHYNGPLDRYAKLRVVHASGMPGTFSPPPPVSDSDMHHGTCVTHVPWCMPGSLTSGWFHLKSWRGKRSRLSRRMRNPQFHMSDKRSMLQINGAALDHTRSVMKSLKEKARIFLLFMHGVDTRFVLITALEEDMLEGLLWSSKPPLQSITVTS